MSVGRLALIAVTVLALGYGTTQSVRSATGPPARYRIVPANFLSDAQTTCVWLVREETGSVALCKMISGDLDIKPPTCGR